MTRLLRSIALAGLAAFFGLALLEHVLEGELEPARHTISEYARTDSGAAITTAFVAWALSLVATAALVGRAGWSRRLVPALLVTAAAGLLLVAAFRTQTSAGQLTYGDRLSLGGRLHDGGSGLTTLALLLAATTTAWLCRPSRLSRALALLILLAGAAQFALLLVGPEVAGVRQRALVVIGLALQLLIVQQTSRQRSNGT